MYANPVAEQQFAKILIDRFGVNYAEDEDFLKCFPSKHRRTFVLRNPTKMNAQELGSIADLLGKPPYELMQEIGLGAKVITIDEMNSLVRKHGMTIDFAHHVA